MYVYLLVVDCYRNAQSWERSALMYLYDELASAGFCQPQR